LATNADTKGDMSANPIGGLSRIATRTFQSFSEAAGAVLELLERELPAGKLVLGELNYRDGEYRVIDTRGNSVEGFERGLKMALPQSFCAHMAEDRAPRFAADAAEDPVYGKLGLRECLSIRSYIGVPLEISDGTRVASLCAVAGEPGQYDQSHLELLTVCGRLLAYEWERVRRELELRRLADRTRDRAASDPITGLLNRENLLASLEREWHLARRGLVDTLVVVFRLQGLGDARERFGDAMAELLLKDAAGALQATARRTDLVGRAGPESLVGALVGCSGEEGADAFYARVQAGLTRVTSERPAGLTLSVGMASLGEAPSAAQALATAEEDVRVDLAPALQPDGLG
jgi:diguanylate cyclase (GGDEF)-like protein